MHLPAEMTRNTSKFYPRWNGELSRTGLHIGTRFSVCSSWNGTEYTTLINTAQPKFGPHIWAQQLDYWPLVEFNLSPDRFDNMM